MGKTQEPAEILTRISQAANEVAKDFRTMGESIERGLLKIIRSWIDEEMEKLYLENYRQKSQGLWLI